MPKFPPRARPSKTNRLGPLSKSRRVIYSSDEEDALASVLMPLLGAAAAAELSYDDKETVAQLRRRRIAVRKLNPFMDAEACVYGKAPAE